MAACPWSSSSSSSASSSSRNIVTRTSASASPPLPPLNPRSPAYILIQECQRECDGEIEEPVASSRFSVSDAMAPLKHYPTPIRTPHHKACGSDVVDGSSSWNKCRPNAREKISAVPPDAAGIRKPSSNHSPSHIGGIFKSLLSTLTKRSPRSPDPSTEEQWRLAAAELSQRLVKATRKRDEAILEASNLKHSVSELERKLNKLETYCNELKSEIEACSTSSPSYVEQKDLSNPTKQTSESFVNVVSDARSSIRQLSRSILALLRQSGGKIHDRVASILFPYDGKIPAAGKSPKSLIVYLEAVLNRAFYEDFESPGFRRGSADQILNPVERCEANLASYAVLRDLRWEEVLTKGTRRFSESFSGFCDRKMSEVMGLIGWNGAWPEPVLQAFFFAAKGVWLVHLLARAVHPSRTIFRAETGAAFEAAYMEEMVGERVKMLVPRSVRVMVSPGFYMSTSCVVKCKVLCLYHQQVSHA